MPTAVAAAPRACYTLTAVSLVALLALALTLVAPVSAQEGTTSQTQTNRKTEDDAGKQEQSVQGGGQQAEDSAVEAGGQDDARAANPLQDAEVTIESSAGTVTRIEIAAADCEVDKGATVTVSDGNVPVTFVNGDARNDNEVDFNIQPTPDQIVVDGFDANELGAFGSEDDEAATVTASSGVACGRDAAAAANEEDDAKDDEDLEDLDCDELLVLFRSEGAQYGDLDRLADSEVRARIEVCLKKEIVQGTAADEDLPDTGGLPLLALAVLGVVSAAAGLSVIRGGRR